MCSLWIPCHLPPPPLFFSHDMTLSQAQVDTQHTPTSASNSVLRPSGSAQHILASPSARLQVLRPKCAFSWTLVHPTFSYVSLFACCCCRLPHPHQPPWLPPLCIPTVLGTMLPAFRCHPCRCLRMLRRICMTVFDRFLVPRSAPQAHPPPPRPVLPGGTFLVRIHGLITVAWQSFFAQLLWLPNNRSCFLCDTDSVSYRYWQLAALCYDSVCQLALCSGCVMFHSNHGVRGPFCVLADMMQRPLLPLDNSHGLRPCRYTPPCFPHLPVLRPRPCLLPQPLHVDVHHTAILSLRIEPANRYDNVIVSTECPTVPGSVFSSFISNTDSLYFLCPPWFVLVSCMSPGCHLRQCRLQRPNVMTL